MQQDQITRNDTGLLTGTPEYGIQSGLKLFALNKKKKKRRKKET